MKKLFTLLMLLLCVGGGKMWADKIGFTSTYDGSGKIQDPTVTSQANLTVAIVRGSQDTGSKKTGKNSHFRMCRTYGPYKM